RRHPARDLELRCGARELDPIRVAHQPDELLDRAVDLRLDVSRGVLLLDAAIEDEEEVDRAAEQDQGNDHRDQKLGEGEPRASGLHGVTCTAGSRSSYS